MQAGQRLFGLLDVVGPVTVSILRMHQLVQLPRFRQMLRYKWLDIVGSRRRARSLAGRREAEYSEQANPATAADRNRLRF